MVLPFRHVARVAENDHHLWCELGHIEASLEFGSGQRRGNRVLQASNAAFPLATCLLFAELETST